jgi:porin
VALPGKGDAMRSDSRLLGYWAFGVVILALHLHQAQGASLPVDPVPATAGIAVNPQAAYGGFLGNGFLGRALGVDGSSGLRLGGFLVPEFDWVASGGVKPDSSFAGIALGLNASVDMAKALEIPGGTLGVELLLSDGGPANDAAGSVQKYTNFDAVAPRDRQQLTQLWWRQRLFDDRFFLQVGKMNGAAIFNTVLNPVIVDDPHLQDISISNLICVPVGLNTTLFGKLSAYPDTAYGAVAHFLPTTNIYASYGLFDGNLAFGDTGRQWWPEVNDYKFHIGELGYSWRLGKLGMPGRLGLGGWRQTGDLYTPALTIEDGATGYYLFANQRIWYREPSLNNAGLIGYFQYGHTGSSASIVNTYLGAGLSAIGLVPGRPQDTISFGMAQSSLNKTPGAGAFFFPEVASESMDLGSSEIMLQTTYQTNLAFGTPNNYWTLSGVAGYTYIPNPGERPDLPAAHVFSMRLVVLF